MTAYSTQMTQRYADMYEAATGDGPYKLAYLFPLTATPSSIMIEGDVMPNRSLAHWNRAYQRFFSLDEVRMVGDTITRCGVLIP